MDTVNNFARGVLSQGYDSSATTLVVSDGQGARFPSTAFNAVWWNSTDYPDPSEDPEVEIIRITARSVDTLNAVRGQEGTSAVAHNEAGKTYKLIAGLTAGMFNALAPAELTINNQSGSYILVLDDSGAAVRINSGSACNLTVPANGDTPFPIGTQVLVHQSGAGQITVVAASGVSINASLSLLLRVQNSSASLIKVGTDEWDLAGDLQP